MTPLKSPRIARRTWWTGTTLLAAGVLALTACGGGGGSTGPQAAASAYAVGPITGFGSIIVNGVHYDDDLARVSDDDGVSRDRSALKLGMVVEVRGRGSDDGVAAQSIVTHSLMRGPVEAVGADSLVVLGQTVTVSPTTFFDDRLAGGLAAVQAGDIVKVYGLLDVATGTYTATRIERHDSGDDPFRLRGVVAAYDAAAATLTIGGAVIDVAGQGLPAGLQAGSLVRVKLQRVQVGGLWVATQVRSGEIRPDDSRHDHAEVEGSITAFTSPTAFSVEGLPVDASQARFDDGTAGLGLGVRVEVEGAIVDGVLVATKVEIKDGRRGGRDDDDDGDVEIKGRIDSVDATAQTLVVRGVTVSFAGDVQYEDGTAADLVPGRKVEVHGVLAADGVTVNATRIELDD
ncbi:DUF5666 domain-containing protein [Rubrivivax albus]|uniref:DUF5666 domain-containing protein n=1 Tax=Rubrivivax albus TaxID=2499835 RepID=A0A3S2WT38_9BURK|nr:DUF5666 domain-containing protein [Rubrivivax albus]RVT50062.1 hypothetical protein ENE75_17245 [Rubrivivax albus]